LLNHKAIHRQKNRGRFIVAVVENNGNEPEVSGTHLLVAVGTKTGITYPQCAGRYQAGMHEINKVVKPSKTNVDGIYALGEPTDTAHFIHKSYNDFEIAAWIILKGGKTLSDRITIHAVFH